MHILYICVYATKWEKIIKFNFSSGLKSRSVESIFKKNLNSNVRRIETFIVPCQNRFSVRFSLFTPLDHHRVIEGRK